MVGRRGIGPEANVGTVGECGCFSAPSLGMEEISLMNSHAAESSAASRVEYDHGNQGKQKVDRSDDKRCIDVIQGQRNRAVRGQSEEGKAGQQKHADHYVTDERYSSPACGIKRDGGAIEGDRAGEGEKHHGMKLCRRTSASTQRSDQEARRRGNGDEHQRLFTDRVLEIIASVGSG